MKPEQMVQEIHSELMDKITETEAALEACDAWLKDGVMDVSVESASRINAETTRKILLEKSLQSLKAEYKTALEQANNLWRAHYQATRKAENLKQLKKALATLQDIRSLVKVDGVVHTLEMDIREREAAVKMWEQFNSESQFKDLLPKVKET